MIGEFIDVRSDTCTVPTPEMYQAMVSAPVGDDVFDDDPTVKKLEELAAAVLGKEAGMYVPTGTMGNQSAIMARTHAGDEIIAGAKSHIINYEGGAPARLSGVGYALVDNSDGTIHPEDVERLCRPLNDNRYPETKMVCLENALYDGRVISADIMKATCRKAHELGLKVHLDGARVFNAAQALGIEARELVSECDSVMFCVSKGLCAPVGSVLVGEKEFIERAKVMRKLMGGGMREAGVIAACGIVSIEKMIDRLSVDHANSKLLANKLSQIEGLTVLRDRNEINMVFFTVQLPGWNDDEYIKFMYDRKIKVLGESEGEYRYCTHNYVTENDVIRLAEATAEYCDTIR